MFYNIYIAHCFLIVKSRHIFMLSRRMDTKVCAKQGSSFLLLVVLEDGSFTSEVVARKIWI